MCGLISRSLNIIYSMGRMGASEKKTVIKIEIIFISILMAKFIML